MRRRVVLSAFCLVTFAAMAQTPPNTGKVAIKGALERAKVKPEEVDEVIMGQILSAGQGQNPARQAAVNAGIPVDKTALGINQLCGSGLRAVAFGWQAIRNGDASIMVVGGQESMSQAPHVAHLRDGTKMGEMKMMDSMLKDGLWDAFHGYHMGNTAENVAQKYQITRAEQDAFAASSQNKAEAAQKSGRFKDEIVPVTVKTRKGDVVVDTDEEALDAIKTFLSYLPSHHNEAPPVKPVPAGSGDKCADLINLIPESRTQVYDMRKILRAISDTDSYFELKARFGKAGVTALARLGGAEDERSDAGRRKR